ncbi:SDR family oxidoreductase [Shigella flexneri]
MSAISPCMKRCSTRHKDQWGRLDCLLDNAGISVKKRGDLLDLEPDSFNQNIAINARAPFFLAQAFVSAYWHSRNRKRNCRTAGLFSSSSINAIMLAMNRGEYTIAKTAVSAAAGLLLLAFVMNKLAL